MSKPYGAAIVGEKAAAEAMAAQKKENRFGPAVLGTSVDQSPEADEHRRGLTPDGPNLLPGGGEATTEGLEGLAELVAQYASDDGYLSIKNVEQVLEEMPASFDRLVGWELGRNDGPRIGALKVFIAHETARDGGPRPNTLRTLETTLATLRRKGD